MNMRTWRQISICLALLIACRPLRALDIVVTNDDGMESVLSFAVYEQLKLAGHRVLIAAPAFDQSGRGGAINFLKPVPALPGTSRGGCVLGGDVPAPGIGNFGMGAPFIAAGCPNDANIFWINGTPADSVLYGIDIAAQARWGKSPDLVISGPNFGNNTGAISNASGTVNAALMALNRGLPAIAVSAAEPLAYRSLRAGPRDSDRELATIVLRVVATLERNRARLAHAHSQPPLLPPGLGLNVNVPKSAPGTAARLAYRLSDMGTDYIATTVFSTDLCAAASMRAQLAAACAGTPRPALAGVSLVFKGEPLPAGASSLADANPRAEQKLIDQGVVAISVMQGTHQAESAAARRVGRQLHALVH